MTTNVPFLDPASAGAGNATAGNQTSQIALETAIRDRLPASGAATETSAAATAAAAGTTADAAWAGTGNSTIVAALKAVWAKLNGTLTTTGVTDAQLRNAPLESISFITNPSANFTRPADTTAYAINDLVANSVTAGSVVPMSFTAARVAAGSFRVSKAKLVVSNTGALNAQLRLHLYRASPTIANGDNGAFSTSGAADYLGAMDILLDRTFTDGVVGFGVPLVGYDKVIKLASGQIIYGLLEARTAFTPASASTYTVTLDVMQN